MKESTSHRLLNIAFVVISGLGIIFSLVGITSIWVAKPRIQTSFLVLLSSSDSILSNTNEGLQVLDSTLDASKTNLDTIESTLTNLDETILSISSSLDSSATLIGDDLRLTVIDTQIALSSAATSAELIDNTLAILAAIPFVGADYQPDVPLHISLDQVAVSLEDVPDSLETIEDSLKDTADGLTVLKNDLGDLAGNIGDFEDDLSDAQIVLLEYVRIIEGLEQRSENFQRNLPLYMTLTSILLSGLLFWLGFAQVIILLQSIIHLRGERQIVNLADIRREPTPQNNNQS